MAKYQVNLTRTFKTTATVEAGSAQEAADKVRDGAREAQWNPADGRVHCRVVDDERGDVLLMVVLNELRESSE